MAAAMGEPKPLASLSSSLLARKGQAKPAMRPQGYAQFGMGVAQPSLEDLGWNDHGYDVEPAPLEPAHVQAISAEIIPIVPEPAPPAVVVQQEELARELEPAPAPAVVRSIARPVAAIRNAPRAAPGTKAKAAFTLRLDPERHLKLRLVCAVNHKSAQATVIAALDAFLETQSAVADLARSAKA
jgi:hypothetical protein